MPFPYIAIGVGLLVAKKIYDVATEGSGSSYSSETSGRSESEVKQEQNEETLKQFEKDVLEFWRKNNLLQCCERHKDLLASYETIARFINEEISYDKLKKITQGYQVSKYNKLPNKLNWNLEILKEFLNTEYYDLDDIINQVNEAITDSSHDSSENFYGPFMVPNIHKLHNLEYKRAFINYSVELIPSLTNNGTLPPLPSLLRQNTELSSLEEKAKLSKQAESGLPRIAVCGFLKAGKSSLLNNLVHDTNNNTFAVGVTRETVVNKELEYKDFLFIDTPGMEANKEDTEEAWKAYTTSDLLLFVHLAEKPLTRQETEVLKQLHHERKDLNKRAIMVLTQADVAGSNIDSLVAEVSEQLKNALGFDFPIFPVSNTLYQKGFAQGKEKLQEKSGMNKLISYLWEIKDSVLANTKEEQKEHTKQCYDNFLSKLEELASHYEDENEKMEQEEKESVDKFINYVIKPAKQAYRY